jgi:chromosome segregation ATPase
MSVMSPLAGVVLSAGLFMYGAGQAAGEAAGIAQALAKLSPLFLGVLCGAGLALINQILLHVAFCRLQDTRSAAVAWFDGVIWSKARSREEKATSGVLDALTAATESLKDAATKCADAGGLIAGAATKLGEKVGELDKPLGDFKQSVQDLTVNVGAARDAAKTQKVALDEFSAELKAIATSAQDQHAKVVTELSAVAGRVGAALARVQEAMDSMTAGAADFSKAARQTDVDAQQHHKALYEHVLPAFAKTVQACQEATRELAAVPTALESPSNALTQSLNDCQQEVSSLTAQVAGISQRAAELTAALEAVRKPLATASTGAGDALSQLAAAAGAVKALNQLAATAVAVEAEIRKARVGIRAIADGAARPAVAASRPRGLLDRWFGGP